MASPGGGDGGSGEPQSVSVRNFVASRVAEIASLTMELKAGHTSSGSQGRTKGFSFQHVSKHMRRRAVSHNPKRLPGRLRGSHLSQINKCSGGIVKQPKRPSRKHRKRAEGNILDFNKRQVGSPSWLESHVWHAKRFHMKPMWEKKLPIAPTAKCFRSLFRAAQNRVVMQDISYLACLEISGPEQVLLDGVNSLFPFGYEGVNKKISNVSDICNNELVGHVFSPSKNAYIGTIRCVWIPGEGENAKQIIWAHPAVKSNLVEELVSIFQLEKEGDLLVPESLPESLSKEEQKYSWKLLMSQRWRNEGTQVQLHDLDRFLNRIRLTGPKSLSILKDLVKIGRLHSNTEGYESEGIQKEQEATWESVERIVSVPNNTVIPLNVVDPRLELPDKRRPPPLPQAQGNREDGAGEEKRRFTPLPSSHMKSPIWDEKVRKHLLRTKLSDAKLAEIRGRNLIPGTEIDPSEEMNVIPIVLVFRVGSHSSDTSTSFLGIDLIIPYGWMMAFWVALSYRCVRAYGLEFTDYLTFEDDPHLLNLSVSTSFSPDAIIYSSQMEQREKEIKEKYFSKSPAKRHNLVKLGCAFPFSLDWPRFLKYSSGADADSNEIEVRVIRRREDVIAMSNYLRNINSPEVFFKSTDLFPVQLTLISGAIEERSSICLPTKEDLENFATGKRTNYRILQSQLKDINESKRAEVNRQHQKRLAHLRKKRKVARKAANSKDFDLQSRLDQLDSLGECSQFTEQLNSLWINEDVESVLSNQDREVIGLVTYAHFSFLRGKSAAVGYISAGQLKSLASLYDQSKIEKFVNKRGYRQLYVLVRSWESSLHYHWAKLSFP